MCTFKNSNGCTITYEFVRQAMNGEPFPMSLVGEAARAAVDAVNIGIDSHLEACSTRGQDRYEFKKHAGPLCCVKLECSVSIESLPVLIRRLFELEGDERREDAARSLAEDILMVLGIDDEGHYVGREALGLE